MSVTPERWQELLAGELQSREEDQLLRRRRIVKPIDATRVRVGDRTLINFCSNDYLGLAHHPRVIAAATAAMASHGLGSGAAGLISGYTDLHASAERAVAAWKNTESAVILPSGYQANLAAVQTIAAMREKFPRGVRFLIDKLAHASLLDAVRATGDAFRVFPHNGMGKLERLLADADQNQLQVVVTESIFSMDGDAADLAGLAELKSRFPFLLLLDEAHGSGVYGSAGSGFAAERGLQSIVDVSVITFSKAIGCVGGAVCGSDAFCAMLVNAGRAYVYSTSIPAAVAGAIEAAIGVLRDEPERQQRLRELSRYVRSSLVDAGLDIRAGDSPIVPIVLGAEPAAVAAAWKLLGEGLLIAAVRPPTVPRGSSRLRVTLSSEHQPVDVDKLVSALKRL